MTINKMMLIWEVPVLGAHTRCSVAVTRYSTACSGICDAILGGQQINAS